MTITAVSQQPVRTLRLRLAALSLAMLLPSLGTSIANVALPTLAASFHAPIHDVQWVVIAYLLAVTTLIVGAGRLGDMLGRRRVLLFGIGIFAAASACGTISPNLWWLVAIRGVQGLGAAIMMALTIAYAREEQDEIDARRRAIHRSIGPIEARAKQRMERNEEDQK